VIVVLSVYPDIWEQFCRSKDLYEPNTPVIPVFSGAMANLSMTGCGPPGVLGREPFSFPRNANMGISVSGNRDVFLVNDDVQFLRPGSLEHLARIAHDHPEVGILSPQFEGRVGNRMQERAFRMRTLAYSEQRLCFTGVYIKRSVINEVGMLNEDFDGYGRDDDEYCMRVQMVGYQLAVTPEVVLRHGFGTEEHSASFKRAGRYPPSGIDGRMSGVWEKWLRTGVWEKWLRTVKGKTNEPTTKS